MWGMSDHNDRTCCNLHRQDMKVSFDNAAVTAGPVPLHDVYIARCIKEVSDHRDCVCCNPNRQVAGIDR